MTLPAQSLDAEESCLGACLMSAGAVDVCSEILVPESFYRHSHGLIFRAILDVAEKGEPVDALTVVGRLDADGKLAAAGGAERVHELSVLTPAASNAAHYAKIVRAMWLRREIASVGHELVALGDNGAESVTDLFGEIDKKFLRLQSQGTRKKDRVFTAKQLVAEYREKLANPLDEDVIGVRSPFSFLSPLMGSRLYVLGGYAGHGKTAAALQFIASGCAGGSRVGFHTIEMSKKDLTDRLVSSFGFPYHDIRSGHVAKGQRDDLEKALETVENWDFEVIDDEEVDPAQIRRDQRSGKYDLLIIDHLHNLRIKDKRHAREELEENVQLITNIAKESDIPVLLLAQLSREEKRNPFPRPNSSSLKGTGKIEQLASHVWFIWRKCDENHQPTVDSEFLITKNRYGGLGFKNLHFRASQVRFTESSAFA